MSKRFKMIPIGMKVKILALLFCLASTGNLLAQKSEITLSENNRHETLRMPWRNCIAVGRAQNLLRADCLEHLAFAQQVMGYRYCRFHAIFDDDMAVVVRNPDRTLTFQWHQVDKVYDALLKIGIRPFVEINPMPTALASGKQVMFGYQMNVTPPKSYMEWSCFMEEFANHLVQRYGIEEVSKWYFEVWNEPNLGVFFGGTKEEYFKLYSTTAIALKKVDPRLRVGGPASSRVNWISDMINYCTANNVPLDFVSTHLYAQDEQVEYPDRKGSPYAIGDYFSETIKKAQQEVKNSVRPNLELHFTEWNSLAAKDAASITWGDNITVDDLYAASFIVRNALELDKVCNTLAYWVVSDIFDEGAIPHSPFSCTYGLMTIQGIPKASFNAFRLLRKMEGIRLDVANTRQLHDGKGKTAPSITVPAAGKGTGAYAVNDLGTIKIILWNQNFVEIPNNQSWSGSIVIPFLNPNVKHVAVSAAITAGKGSPWESWQVMGAPQNLSNTQLELLKAHSNPYFGLEKLAVTNGALTLDFRLTPGEVKYIEISPKGQAAVKRGIDEAAVKLLESQLSQATHVGTSTRH